MVEKGWIRVNKDSIREQLFCDSWKPKNEKQVIRVRNLIIKDTLSNGKNIIIDDTNLNPIHEKEIQNIAKEFNATVIVNDSFLAIPVETCVKRDLKRLNSVGEKVIQQMYNKYLKPNINKLNYDESLGYAVIFDIDGTLAHMKNRNPYDWAKVGNDDIDSSVAFIADALAETKRTKIFVFSGRDSICRPETEDWLDRNDIEYDSLYMRPEGDTRKDTEVKKEMYQSYIEGQYNLLGVFDDRPCVCDMWRSLGIKVFQVGDPHDEF